jgi:hypothetical protein
MSGLHPPALPVFDGQSSAVKVGRRSIVNRLWTGALEVYHDTGFVAVAADVEYDDGAAGAVAVSNRRSFGGALDCKQTVLRQQ